jgi:hypothetical protein
LQIVAAKILIFEIPPPVTKQFLQRRRPVEPAELLESADTVEKLDNLGV